MKLQIIVQHVKLDRKLLKPQVERKRRERINRSLETLCKMLMQDKDNNQKRAEKAEILEHTVAFLKTSDVQSGFQSGFSSCLQRASEFLHTAGLTREQQESLSSRLDMVASRLDMVASRLHSPPLPPPPHHHLHHQKPGAAVPLSPPVVSRQPSPRASALKALLSHRWAGDLTSCHVTSPRGERTGMAASNHGDRKTPCTPPSAARPSPSAPLTTATTPVSKTTCHPRRLLAPAQPMWRPWP
ncbi:transcription factor HES-7-like [Engraulis encrasicolus]|uniref:transcription factor HES-7-like n=1 Tax=Engraulis encrasicolus TaxID=184585 RepID=UPI002FD032EC